MLLHDLYGKNMPQHQKNTAEFLKTRDAVTFEGHCRIYTDSWCRIARQRTADSIQSVSYMESFNIQLVQN
jgi:hypothetical protein